MFRRGGVALGGQVSDQRLGMGDLEASRSSIRSATAVKSLREADSVIDPVMYPAGVISPAVVQPITRVLPNTSAKTSPNTAKSYWGEQKTSTNAVSGWAMASCNSTAARRASM